MAKLENMINTHFRFGYEKIKSDIYQLSEDESYTMITDLDLGSNQTCKIIIWSNESCIPHFHIVFPDVNTEFNESSLCILYPRYYIHKDNFKKLTNSQLKAIEDWLHKSTLNQYTTNWFQICIMWEKFNWFKHYVGQDKIKSIPIPKYHLMNDDDILVDDDFYLDYNYKEFL